MKLQAKMALSLLLLGGVFTTASYFGMHALLHPILEAVDRESTIKDLARVEQLVNTELQSLNIVAADYANWDHTFDFVQGRRDQYIVENLDWEFWKNVDIHMMQFFDVDGRLIWGSVADPTYSRIIPMDDLFSPPIAASHPVLSAAIPAGEAYGLIPTGFAPMMIAAHPVRRSSGSDLTAGTMIVGKFFNEERVSAIRDQAYLEFEFADVSNKDANIENDGSAVNMPADADGLYWRVDHEEIYLGKRLADVLGNPSFYLELRKPRSIEQLGHRMVDTSTALVLAFSVVMLLSFWWFMRQIILAPIGSLTKHMLRMRDSGNLKEKITLNRNDEIGQLANEFDLLTGEVKQVQTELEESRDDALNSAAAKSEFLARMSHEIRTPMNGILGMIELLQSSSLETTQRRYAHTIHESADKLLDIINDVLDFSKIEAGKLTLENISFDLNSFLSDIIESLRILAENKNLTLECDCPAGPQPLVRGDAYRLRQVLTNLIGNAVKFTESGRVSLIVTAEALSSESQNVTFKVMDTGVGISKENQASIFDSFSQEDGSTTRRFGGSGLGLAISKQLVDMMGGTLMVDSELDKGSTFSFTLALKTQNDGVLDSPAPVSGRYGSPQLETAWQDNLLTGKILLAEDNVVNQEVAIGLLYAMGLEVVVADNGSRAMELIKSESFDLVLMDCHMPVMDGYQATRAVRELESQTGAKPIGIIAVTANALPGDRDRCVAAGMDDYISKPFSGERLYAKLADYLPAAVDMTETTDMTDKTLSVIDQSVLEQLDELVPDGDSLAKKVIGAYLDNSDSLISGIEDGIDAQDPGRVRENAHALKSSSANVGAVNLAELCRKVENAGREGDLPTIRDHWQQLSSEYGSVVIALRELSETIGE